MDEPDIAPDGTMMLEPRDLYDQAYLGYVHQGGITIAVYSMSRTIELIYEANLKDGSTTEDAYTDAVEHYSFNVSGSIGVGYPVFQVEPFPLELGRLARAYLKWSVQPDWRRMDDAFEVYASAQEVAEGIASAYAEED